MSTRSNDLGRAYEFAWINALCNALKQYRAVRIVENSSLEANQRAWNLIDAEKQELFEISAEAALKTVVDLEPKLVEKTSDDLLLEFQRDQAGVKGDVRDIVVKCDSVKWEIGFSVKHNHEAVKHSRLSHALDFGQEWFDIPCSSSYWDSVKPIFDNLKAEKAKYAKWSDIAQKDETVYVPLLQAFMDEVQRAYKSDKTLPRKMVEYLVGTKDYYKIVSRDSKRLTIVETFNLHGTLNKPGKVKVSAITVPVIDLPTELVALKFKTGSKNTVEMYLNNGWQLSFRIHSASTKVEPSLKFDSQFIGMPVSVLSIECKWK